MRRWFLLVPLAIVLVLVGVLLPVLFPRPSKVTRENCERIQVGMTRVQVEEILGGPAGDYRSGPTNMDTVILAGGIYGRVGDGSGDDAEICGWTGDEASVTIQFSVERVKIAPFVLDTRSEPVSPLELVRWRLSRWRERMFPQKP
jgi:SmpA / OmlA family